MLTVPFYTAFKTRLKWPFQGTTYWLYWGGIGFLWSVHLWNGFRQDLLEKPLNLEPHGMEILSQHTRLIWIEAGLMIIFLAMPLVWNWRDRRNKFAQPAK